MSNTNIKESEIKIGGMSCAMCVKSVEKSLKKIDGMLSVNVNLATETASIEYEKNKISNEDIKNCIEKAGYHYIGTENEETDEETERKKDLKLKLIRVIIGMIVGIPMMVIMLTIPHSMILSYVLFAISTPLFIFLGFNIFKSAFNSLKHKSLDMNVMYFLGMGSAYIASVLSTFGILSHEFMFYETPIMLAAFLNLGKYLEGKAKGRTSQSIKKLMGLQAKMARVIKNGKEIEISIKELQIDDIIIVKPGEKIPTDGIVMEGSSYIDESMITGEPIPNLKAINDEVIGGTINKNSVLKIKTVKVGKDTLLAQIIKFVKDAQNSKLPIQGIADKAVSYFIPVVLGIAVLTFIFWFLIISKPVLFSFSTFVAVIVIACPCALGLATPTAITVGLGKGADLGILIKNGEALEISNKLTTIVVDKTGTLTKGKPEVTDIITYNTNENDLLILSASVENNSQHPLAQSIVNKAKEKKLELKNVNDFDTFEGKGLIGFIEGSRILIGSRKIITEYGISINDDIENSVSKLESDGKTTILIAKNKNIIGIIAVADSLKESTKSAIDKFKKSSLEVIMITGDNSKTSNAIAKQIGIDKVIAEVLPKEKAEEVKKLQLEGKIVSFIGDGINDAPALAQADVGIALGSGTDIAMESGDIVLMKDDLNDAYYSIKLSKKVMGKIKQNLFWAFAYNTILIPIAAGALSSFGITLRPEFAGLAMAMSSVTVVTLSLLLKRYNPHENDLQ